MRSGLQPVAISCNKNFYHGPFVALVGARALSENASNASNVLRKPILCKKTNFAEVALCEGRRCASRYSCPGQAAEPEGERFVTARRVMQAAGGHGKDAQQLRFAAVASLSENTMCPPVDDPGRSTARRSDRPRRGREPAPEYATWAAAKTISGR